MPKIRITFKTPDAVSTALSEEFGDLEEENEKAYQEAEEALGKFVKYGELVTIEFDTDEGTAEVLEQ